MRGKSEANLFVEAYQLLFEHYGPQGWWPAESRFEMMVGAVLTQNTNWKNVEKAIENLRAKGLLDLRSLVEAPEEIVADAIRPSGYYNLKVRRLKNMLNMIVELYGGDLEQFFQAPPSSSRSDLLLVKGVGPETADSILLYAGGWPVFVVDSYTHRVFNRHYLVEEETDYHSIQDLFMDHLDEDAELFNEYHALIVRVAKDFCRKSDPLCDTCPLHGLNW